MDKIIFILYVLLWIPHVLMAQFDKLVSYNDNAWEIKSSDPKKAHMLSDSAILLATQFKSISEEARAWSTKAHIWGSEGQYKPCYAIYQRVKYLRSTIKDSSGIASVYNNIANFKFNEGQLGEALLFLDTAVSIYIRLTRQSQINDSLNGLNLCRLGITYETKSKILQAYDEPEEALYSARLGKQIFSRLPDRAREQALADYTIGNSFYCLYTKTEQEAYADSALIFYNKALSFYKNNLSDTDWMAMLCHNYGVIELERKHFANAWKLLTQSETISTEYDDSIGIFNVLVHKGLWFFQQGRHKESLATLKQAQAMNLRQISLDELLFFCTVLAESYEKNGILDSALSYQKIGYDLRGRLLSEDKNKLLQKFRLKEKELQLANEKTRADKNASKALWLTVLAGLLFVLTALLVLVLRQKAKLNYLKGSLQGKEKALDSLSKRLHEEVQVYMNAAANSIANAQQHLSELSVAATQLGFAKNKLRDISHDIGTTILKHVGIHATLEELCERISDRQGDMVAQYEQSGITQRLPFDLELTVFRLAHLLTDNTLKHAKAHTIEMRLSQEPEGILFKYRDDGVGFNFQEALLLPNNSGLKEMQDLVQNIRAKMTVDAPSDEGIQFSFLFPKRLLRAFGDFCFLCYDKN